MATWVVKRRGAMNKVQRLSDATEDLVCNQSLNSIQILKIEVQIQEKKLNVSN